MFTIVCVGLSSVASFKRVWMGEEDASFQWMEQFDTRCPVFVECVACVPQQMIAITEAVSPRVWFH